MTDWLEFLARPAQSDGSNASPPIACGDGYVASLDDLDLLVASGADAAHFLHNQLTNDVEHLSLVQARLAGYCNPKGRLLATVLMWRTEQGVILELAREILPAIHKRLQMFVMRSKVTLSDSSTNPVILGFGGAAAERTLSTWFAELPATPYAKVESTAGVLIRLADADAVPRYQWITTTVQAIAAWPALQSQLQVIDSEQWRGTEIAACVPHITRATQEKFVPQMVNLEALGGVNFKKGCYPGQEIVARSQYLGKLKRRMLPASVTAPEVHAGMEVFAAGDSEQPCGMIVNAARRGDGITDCLVEIKTAAREHGPIFLGIGGPPLHFTALPYPLPDSV